MTKAYRIVKFTFYTNSLLFLLISGILGSLLLPTGVLMGYKELLVFIMSILVGAIGFADWFFIEKVMGAKLAKGGLFYFIDDERDKQIAHKVHTTLFGYDSQFGSFAILIIPIAVYVLTISGREAMISLIVSWLVSQEIINYRYWYLWRKLDR